MTTELVPSEPTGEQTEEVLAETRRAVIEALTALGAGGKEEVFRSVGHILQRMRSVPLLDALRDEWIRLREEGRIDDEYVNSDQHLNCFQEILGFIDEETPDDTRFKALKAIFLNAATERFEDRDSLLPYHYMRVARKLDSGEVLILRAAYDIQKTDYEDDSHARSWLERIAEESGLKFPALVEVHERNLIEKKLLSPRKHPDDSGVNLGEGYRLTDFGRELCQFMSSYEPDEE